MRLDGKTVIVTGAAQGMGAATAVRFAAEGAHVVLTDINEAAGIKLADEIGACFHRLDVADEDQWRELAEAVIADRGAIDGLVNNAGIYFNSLIEDTDLAALRKLLDIDLVGPWLGMRAVTPHMKQARKGSIVNISSVEGIIGHYGATAYTAAKWGLRGMTKSLAKEVGPFGVRVNTVNPGAIETPLLQAGTWGVPFDTMFPDIAMNRPGRAEEVAAASLFLISDDSTYVSGADLTVDGAWTCGGYLNNKPVPASDDT